MTPNERKTNILVGLFVLIGLSAVAVMVVYFGRLGSGLRSYYRITVEYPNASGLVVGADVLMSGAKIGEVATRPEILPSLNGVSVELKIYDDIRIPDNATFIIGSSGLLGDRYVDILLREDSKDAPSIKPGAVVQGRRQSGMDDLAKEGELLLADIRKAVKNIDHFVQKIDNEILGEKTLKTVDDTLQNLKRTSEAFATASEKIDGTIAEINKAAAAGTSTLESTKKAADELQKAVADIRGLIREARHGKGIIARLLNDQQIANDVAALVSNMRRRGIIWYRDVEDKKPASR